MKMYYFNFLWSSQVSNLWWKTLMLIKKKFKFQNEKKHFFKIIIVFFRSCLSQYISYFFLRMFKNTWFCLFYQKTSSAFISKLWFWSCVDGRNVMHKLVVPSCRICPAGAITLFGRIATEDDWPQNW